LIEGEGEKKREWEREEEEGRRKKRIRQEYRVHNTFVQISINYIFLAMKIEIVLILSL